MATDSLSAAMPVRTLLGHQRFGTSERHYIQAEQIEDSGKINESIRSARVRAGTD